MWSPSRISSFVAITTVAVVLSACGFHLRGAGDVVPWPKSLDSLRLEGTSKTSDALKYELTRLLQERYGVAVTSDPKAPVLRISKEHFTRSSLALSISGKTSEYRLQLEAVATVNDGAGKTLVPGTVVQVQRSFLYERKEVLAMEAEEQRLRAAMVHEVALRILRRIAARYARGTS
ncbi:MAG: LPS assembly lipoprotein LptE [Acidiferrobacteraceae bacterium]|jgi:LPS-assembly lipoprotein